MAGRVERRI